MFILYSFMGYHLFPYVLTFTPLGTIYHSFMLSFIPLKVFFRYSFLIFKY